VSKTKKIVIKTNHNMTVGLWLNDEELEDVTRVLESNKRVSSVILSNGMELNFTIMAKKELSIISNAKKNYRKVFSGEIDTDDLYRQLITNK